MHFSRIALFALPAIAAAAVLPRDNVCNIGFTQYCCNTLQKADTLSEGQKQLASLAGFNLDNAGAQFGTSCTPITSSVGGPLSGALSKSSASCGGQNSCCQQSYSHGLINSNCSPIVA